MFCKNCGKPMNENQAICLECGVKAGEGNHFCANCGQPVAPNAAVCTHCGVAVTNAPADGAKRKLVTLLLAIFLGGFGAHNFYLGYTKNAVIQLVVSLLLSWTGVAPLAMYIWGIIEGVKAYQGNLPDANGNALVD